MDTSTASGSLAIARFSDSGPKILGELIWQKKAMHSEVATLELERLLQQTNLQLKDITHFAVNVGPGSFTGLRVGINLVRTLAYALDKPVAKFSSLEVLAFLNCAEGEKLLVATKAVQNYLYAGVFQKQGGKIITLVEPYSTEIAEARARAQGFRSLIEGEESLTDAGTSARTLVQMTATASFFGWNHIKPLYVRGSEAEEKLKKGILKALS